MTDTITVHLTPGELLEAVHALKHQPRFTTTEQRANAESAIQKLKEAYDAQNGTRCRSCMLLEVFHQDDKGIYWYTCPHSKPEHQCIVSPNQFACPHFTPNEP